MDFFLSHYAAKLDAKGRVLVPAAFRNVLARETFSGLALRLCAEAPAVDCGGAALIGEMDRLLAQNPDLTSERDLLATHVLGGSLVVKLDGQGRCVLPDSFRAHASVVSDVVFVGLGHKFQIWEPNLFQQRCAAAQTRLRELTGSPSSFATSFANAFADPFATSFDGQTGGCE